MIRNPPCDVCVREIGRRNKNFVRQTAALRETINCAKIIRNDTRAFPSCAQSILLCSGCLTCISLYIVASHVIVSVDCMYVLDAEDIDCMCVCVCYLMISKHHCQSDMVILDVTMNVSCNDGVVKWVC